MFQCICSSQNSIWHRACAKWTVVKRTNHRPGQPGALPWASLLPSSCFTQWARSPWSQGEESTWSPHAFSPLLDNSLRPRGSLAKQPQICFQQLEQPLPQLYPNCKSCCQVQPLVLKDGQGTALSGVGQRLDMGAGVITCAAWMAIVVMDTVGLWKESG